MPEMLPAIFTATTAAAPEVAATTAATAATAAETAAAAATADAATTAAAGGGSLFGAAAPTVSAGEVAGSMGSGYTTLGKAAATAAGEGATPAATISSQEVYNSAKVATDLAGGAAKQSALEQAGTAAKAIEGVKTASDLAKASEAVPKTAPPQSPTTTQSLLKTAGQSAAGAVGAGLVSSILSPKPKAPTVPGQVPMPDPLAQEAARRASIAAQMARSGRMSTILTQGLGD